MNRKSSISNQAATVLALALFAAIYSGGLGLLYIAQHIAGGAA